MDAIPHSYRIEGERDFIMVRVPGTQGRYLRTHKYPLRRACPKCDALAGEPCTNDYGRHVGESHRARRLEKPTCAECGTTFGDSMSWGGRRPRYCFPCLGKRRLAAANRSNVRHPERGIAHRAVYAAVLSGQLVRPEACSNCHTLPGPLSRIEAHHHSYEPEFHLDVEWLCRSCHKRRHAQLRKESS